MELALHIEMEDAIENAVQLFRSWQASLEDYLASNATSSKEGAIKR
jgi:predicted nucleic-acid-binding protein